MSDFEPIDGNELAKELEGDANFAEAVASYAKQWADIDTKDRPESEVIEAGRNQLLKAFPVAVGELSKMAKFGNKDDSVRAGVCKFIITVMMRDPAVNGDDKMSKMLREFQNSESKE